MEKTLVVTISKRQKDWIGLLLKEGKITDSDAYISTLIDSDISKNEKLANMFIAIEKRIEDKNEN